MLMITNFPEIRYLDWILRLLVNNSQKFLISVYSSRNISHDHGDKAGMNSYSWFPFHTPFFQNRGIGCFSSFHPFVRSNFFDTYDDSHFQFCAKPQLVVPFLAYLFQICTTHTFCLWFCFFLTFMVKCETVFLKNYDCNWQLPMFCVRP